MASSINANCVKNTVYFGGITLITAGLITMFVCGILGRIGKLPIPHGVAISMALLPPMFLLLLVLEVASSIKTSCVKNRLYT